MTTLLPAIVGGVYAATAIMRITKGDCRWATVWGGYAIAQVGLAMASYKAH